MDSEEKPKKKKPKKSKKSGNKYKKKHGSLSECVTHAVEEYFSHLDKAETTGFYDLVIREVEAPMLKVVMEQTNSNQSVAAQVLGLNRGTLRKKLKEYDLL